MTTALTLHHEHYRQLLTHQAARQLKIRAQNVKKSRSKSLYHHARLREALDPTIALYEAWDAAKPDKGYAGKAAEWGTRTTGFEPPETR